MANLVITVIAISLVAVASIMSAYYGGSVFLEATGKANSSAIINQGAQISAAWAFYQSQNNSVPTDLTTDLTPEYLSELPTPPPALTTSYAFDTYGGFRLLTLDMDNLADVCLEIAIATGQEAAGAVVSDINTVANTADLTAAVTGFRFGCVQVTDVSVPTAFANPPAPPVSDANDYLFFHRL